MVDLNLVIQLNDINIILTIRVSREIFASLAWAKLSNHVFALQLLDIYGFNSSVSFPL
jgi:hypothetical protein